MGAANVEWARRGVPFDARVGFEWDMVEAFRAACGDRALVHLPEDRQVNRCD